MQQRKSRIPSCCRSLCLLLIFNIVFLTGAVAPKPGVEACLPSADLPPALTATASTQDKNIIWYVEMGAQDAERTVSFTASYNAAYLRLCEGLRTSEELAYNGTLSTDISMNSSNSVLKDISYTYTGRLYTSATTLSGVSLSTGYYKPHLYDRLLECRFVSSWDLNPAHFTISNTNDNALITEWVVMGDINEDGSINSTDAQLALQHSVNQIVLDGKKKIAADVNEDGIIDASDALLMNQYGVQLIDTFWNDYSAPSTLPTGQTEGIVSGATYTIQNDYNANGITYSSLSSGSSILQTRYSPTSSAQQFVVVYKSSGEYELQSKSNTSLVWAKSSSNELILQTRTTSASSAQRWYIVKNSDGTYQFINKANTARCLTVAGNSDTVSSTRDGVEIGTSSVGNKWRLCRDVGRTSYDYYDASFAVRYETYEILNSDIIFNSHPVRLIGDARAAATQVFGTLLGVNIKYSSVSGYESTADACRNGRNVSLTFTSSIFDDESTYDVCELTTGIHNHGYYPSTAIYGEHAGERAHCTDDHAQNDNFDSDHPVTDTKRITTFWSGAQVYRLTSSGYVLYNRSNSFHEYIHMTDLRGTGYAATGLTAVYLHEMAHQWGAPDHYHEIGIDGECLAGKKGICSETSCETFKDLAPSDGIHRPKTCMMYHHDRWDETQKASKLFCSGCVSDMKEYLVNFEEGSP